MSNGTIELPPVDVSPGSGTPSGTVGTVGVQPVTNGGESDRPASVVYTPGGFNTSSGQYFDQITRYPYLTRAVVVVNGMEYFEWESVAVTMEYGNAYTFRLTTSEQEPWPEAFAFFRIKPNDKCEIYLDGYKAINGIVSVRQVAYNATSHTVEIQGVSYAALTQQGTVASQTGEFKNQDLMSIAQQVAKPFGVNVSQTGPVPGDPFPRATVTPGETAWDFIETLARQRGTYLTSNPNGDLVLAIGGMGGGDEVVEGKNILEGREHIQLWNIPASVKAGGQAPGTDQSWGPDPTHQRNHDGQQGSQDAGMNYMPQRILSEMPAFSIDQMKKRFGLEQSFNDAVKIEVTVTLLGWRTPSGGGIWVPGQDVYVDAPMLIMKRKLQLKRVTFTQDNTSGTRATLTLVNDLATKQVPD